MKNASLILGILFIIIFFLIVGNITLNNVLSTQGIILSQVQDRAHVLEDQNIILEDKVLHLSSLTHIASQAAQLGYVPVTLKTQIALSNSVPLAYSQ